MSQIQPHPHIDWASTPDGSHFYAADILDCGHAYGTLCWTEPGRAGVTIYGPTFSRIDGYLDASAMTRVITREEFEAAKKLNFPPLAEVTHYLENDSAEGV